MNRYPYRCFVPLSLAVALALLLPAVPGGAQGEFAAIPKEAAPLYHLNFARNFFAGPAAEKAQRSQYESTLKALEALKGKVAASADNLYNAMALSGRMQQQFASHDMYLYLRYAVDTRDEQSKDEEARLGADADRRTSFMQQELMRIDDKTLNRYVAQKPALAAYRFAIEQARRFRPHTLSLKEEELLSATGPLMSDWEAQLYERGLDRTRFGTVGSPGAELDVRKQQGEIENSPDRAVREAGFKKRYEGYASQRDLYAFALARLIRANNQLAQLHHFPDAPSANFFGLYLTVSEVKGLFERLAQQADFNKRYQRLKADHIKKISGYDDVNVWDLTVIPPGAVRPRFTIGEATPLIEQTLAPFGADYSRELAALLDAKNGRLDIAPGEHRAPGAFAMGFPGGQTSIFYDYNFEGYFEDISTLTHEGGHAVHYQLMEENHVLPVYVQGPSYFFESFAMFNELLLADALQRQATDTFRKTYFLERFLDQAMATFPITRQAALEQAMYDGVREGKMKTADDFDTLARKNGKRYSIWFVKHPELGMEWIDVHHYYDAPMYYVNYVYANFLAMTYYRMYTQNREQFVPKYIALMKNGFNAEPDAILRKFLDVSLRDPKLVSDTFPVLEGKIRELEGLYGK